MTESIAGNPLTDMRRRDRARDDAWIRAFLHAVPFGILATVEDGRPFLNSNLFVYDDDAHALYFHTARTGRTPTNLARPAPVTFTAGVMGRLLPADEALEFSVEYASVVVFGQGRLVGDDGEARRALQMLLDRYAPHLEPGRPPTPDGCSRVPGAPPRPAPAGPVAPPTLDRVTGDEPAPTPAPCWRTGTRRCPTRSGRCSPSAPTGAASRARA